ncbi:transposase [Pseudoduganella namucuonensis]|nr:transposase [Pseudoduganella namucuonensis]
MPANPRIHPPGYPLHIVQRGHNHAPCFLDGEDFDTYLRMLNVALEKTGCRLHAYVLMKNHVHLLLTPSEPGAVAKLFMSLGGSYVPYFNRKYGRSGTLWERRYYSSVIDSEEYLLCCYRYIEMNPVRAAIVDDPAFYRYSSYRANALGEPCKLITPHESYMGMASDAYERRLAYQALFREQLEPGVMAAIRASLHQSKPVGNSKFINKVAEITRQKCEIVPRGRPQADK